MGTPSESLVEVLATAYGSDRDELASKVSAVLDEARARGFDDARIDEQVESWIAQLPLRRDGWLSSEAALRDLRRLLLGPQSWFAMAWQWMRRAAGRAVDHYVAFASVVAVIGGVFYGLAYTRFYESLDITPEQAGLTPTQILSHSVVGGLALTLLVAVAVFCVFVPVIPLQDDKASGEERGRWRDFASNAALSALALLVVIAIAAIAGVSLWASIQFFGLFTAMFFLAGSLRVKRKGWRLAPYPAALDLSLDRYRVAFVAAALPLGLLFACLVTFAEAERLGEKASIGKAVRDPKIVGLPFLGVRAEPALISWRPGVRQETVPECVLYLGSSNGSAILYDHQSSSTFHVPSSDIAIELRSEKSTCEAPVNVRLPTIERREDGMLACRKGGWQHDENVEYEYVWVLEGHTLENHEDVIEWLIGDRYLRDDLVLYCEVTARTPLGEDTAVSRPFITGDGMGDSRPRAGQGTATD